MSVTRLINTIVSDRRTKDRQTGSKESIPPLTIGLAAADSPRHEGDGCGFGTAAFHPALWIVNELINPQAYGNRGYKVVSYSLIHQAQNTRGQQYSHIGGRTPGGGQSPPPSAETIIPGDAAQATPDAYSAPYDPYAGGGYGGGGFPAGGYTGGGDPYVGNGSSGGTTGGGYTGGGDNDFYRGYQAASGGYSGSGYTSYAGG